MSRPPFDPYQAWLNIPPDERPINHYRLLGLAMFEGDAPTIHAAADERMRLMRTFQTGPRAEHSQRLMTELSRAKACLVDATSKAKYDAELRASLAPALESPPLQAPPVHVANPQAIAPPLADSQFPSPSINELEETETTPQSTPIYFQPWFPVLVVAGVMLLGVSAWAIAVVMRSGDNDQHVDTTSTETPTTITATVPLDEETEPDDNAVVIMQEAGGEVNLSASTATLAGAAGLDVRDGINLITGIASPEDQATWHFHIDKAAAFRIEATYATTPQAAGGTFVLKTDDEQTKSLSTRDTGGENSFTSERIGFIWLRRKGDHRLTLVPQTIPEGQSLMTLRLLRLIPVTGS